MAYNHVEASAYSALLTFTKMTMLSDLESKRRIQEKIEIFVLRGRVRMDQYNSPPVALEYYCSTSLVNLMLNSPVDGDALYDNIIPFKKHGIIFDTIQKSHDRYLYDLESFNHYAATQINTFELVTAKIFVEEKKEKTLSALDNIQNNATDIEYRVLRKYADDVTAIKNPPGIALVSFARYE